MVANCRAHYLASAGRGQFAFHLYRRRQYSKEPGSPLPQQGVGKKTPKNRAATVVFSSMSRDRAYVWSIELTRQC